MPGFPDFRQKKKPPKINWLWIISLFALGLMVVFGQSMLSPAPVAVSPTPVSTAVSDTVTAPSTADGAFLPDYDTTLDPAMVTAKSDSRPFWQVAVDMGVKLLLVIGLVYATLIGIRWLQKFKNPITGGGATIQLLETVGLAPGRSLHLIVVGEKTLLLGSTDQQISLLSELADAHVPLPADEPVILQPTSEFEAQLASTQAASTSPVDVPPVESPWQATMSKLHLNIQEMRHDVVEGFENDLA